MQRMDNVSKRHATLTSITIRLNVQNAPSTQIINNVIMNVLRELNFMDKSAIQSAKIKIKSITMGYVSVDKDFIK
jgi:hypothetical protein